MTLRRPIAAAVVLGRMVALAAILHVGLSPRSSHAQAQPGVMDAGSFSIAENGVRLGREQFSVRRAPAPDGTAFEIRSESVVGERRMTVQQSVDSAGSPVHYTLEIRDGASVDVRAGGQRVRGRFATLARRGDGEAAREYMLGTTMVVVEPGFYHQLENVLRARRDTIGARSGITVLSLLENTQRQVFLALETREDTVTIAGVRTRAARWRLEGDGFPARTLWADAEGRLLKVNVPSLAIEVVRDDVPK